MAAAGCCVEPSSLLHKIQARKEHNSFSSLSRPAGQEQTGLMRKVSLLIPLLTLLPPGDCDRGQEVARLGTAAKPRPVGTAAKPGRPGGRQAREFKYTLYNIRNNGLNCMVGRLCHSGLKNIWKDLISPCTKSICAEPRIPVHTKRLVKKNN